MNSTFTPKARLAPRPTDRASAKQTLTPTSKRKLDSIMPEPPQGPSTSDLFMSLFAVALFAMHMPGAANMVAKLQDVTEDAQMDPALAQQVRNLVTQEMAMYSPMMDPRLAEVAVDPNWPALCASLAETVKNLEASAAASMAYQQPRFEM